MRQPRDSSYAAALASGEFRALLAASVLSVAGNVMADITLTVLVYDRTRSAALSALTFTFGFLPYLLTGTVLSPVVDKVPPRTLLAAGYGGAAGVTACMAAGGMPVAALFALVLAAGMANGLANAAVGGLIRTVVAEAAYVPARSLRRIASQVAQVAGNPVGGFAIVLLSPGGAFSASAAVLLAAAALAWFGVRPHPVAGVSEGGMLRDAACGIAEIFRNVPLRRLLLLSWLVPLFSVAPEALAAPYIATHGGSPTLVGWWLAGLPVGMVIGDMAGVWLLPPSWQRRLTGAAAAASFAPYLAFFVSPPVPVAIGLLVLAGMGSMYSLGLDARVRDAAQQRTFARTMAISNGGLMTIQAVGFTLAGVIGQLATPAAAVGIAGICGVAVVASLWPARSVQRWPEGSARVRSGALFRFSQTPRRVPAWLPPATRCESGPLAANSRAGGPFFRCPMMCHLVALRTAVTLKKVTWHEGARRPDLACSAIPGPAGLTPCKVVRARQFAGDGQPARSLFGREFLVRADREPVPHVNRGNSHQQLDDLLPLEGFSDLTPYRVRYPGHADQGHLFGEGDRGTLPFRVHRRCL
ncbi:MAG: MFS transporter [Trebonia sp.]